MAKVKRAYVCTECGMDHAKWQGQCKSCESWETLKETIVGGTANEERQSKMNGYTGIISQDRIKLRDVQLTEADRLRTGIHEFDRVLGGGLVIGSSVLIGGNPGAGKSTLLLQTLDCLVKRVPTFYVTGEESLTQVAMRSNRLKLPHAGNIDMIAETNVENILSQAKDAKPEVMVVDSIQVMHTNDCASAPGSVSQVRECAAMFTKYAKQSGCSVFIIGHVNKDNSIAGPKTLEHAVDVSLMLEGSSDSRYRMLRSLKNRFGAVNELGCFAMMEEGLREVPNPSAIFLTRPERPVSGSVVAAIWEGTRPILVEIQALADTNSTGNSRRLTVGLDSNRTTMLLAVLSRHVGVVMASTDVFINVVAGLKITETSCDLAVTCAFMSSFKNRPVPHDLIVFGELGLSGEIRPVPQGPERLREAAKHGFRRAIVPKANATKKIEGMTLYGVETVQEAVDKLDEL